MKRCLNSQTKAKKRKDNDSATMLNSSFFYKIHFFSDSKNSNLNFVAGHIIYIPLCSKVPKSLRKFRVVKRIDQYEIDCSRRKTLFLTSGTQYFGHRPEILLGRSTWPVGSTSYAGLSTKETRSKHVKISSKKKLSRKNYAIIIFKLA